MKKTKKDTLTLTIPRSLRDDIELVSTSLGITSRSLMLLCAKDRLSREDTLSFMYRGESNTEVQNFQGDTETFSQMKKRADAAGLYVADYVRTAFEIGVEKYKKKVKPEGERNAHLLEQSEESNSCLTVRLPNSLRRVVSEMSEKMNMSNQAIMRSAFAYQAGRTEDIKAVLADHGDALRLLTHVEGLSSFVISPTYQVLKEAFDSEVEQMPKGVTMGLYMAAVVHDLIYNVNVEKQPFIWTEGLKDNQAVRDYVTLFDSLLADKELEPNAAVLQKGKNKDRAMQDTFNATPNEPSIELSRTYEHAKPITQATPSLALYMGTEERIAFLLNQVNELINQQQVKGVPFRGIECVETFIEAYDELLNPSLY